MSQPNVKALYVIYKTPFREKEDGTQLALHMQYWNDGDDIVLAFYDTNRGHMLDGTMTEETENSFTWTRNSGEVFKFREVTIEDFKEKYAPTVLNGVNIANTLHTTQDLWEWYRRKFPI